MRQPLLEQIFARALNCTEVALSQPATKESLFGRRSSTDLQSSQEASQTNREALAASMYPLHAVHARVRYENKLSSYGILPFLPVMQGPLHTKRARHEPAHASSEADFWSSKVQERRL